MKRKSMALAAIALIGATTLIAGCAGDPPVDGADPTAATGAATEAPVTITILDAFASEEPHGQFIYDYAEAYMAEHENVTIEVTAISSNDIYAKLAAMATDPDSLPTLFFTSGDNAPSIFNMGIAEDLTGVVDQATLDGFAPGVVDGASLDGVLAYFPVDVQPLAMLYRTDRFEEAGLSVPTNWDEFVDAAIALNADTDGDGAVDQWGYSLVGANNSSGQSRFMSYLWSSGLKVVAQDGDQWVTDVNTPEFLEAFTKWTDMNSVAAIVPPGITSIDYPTAANYFAMGTTSLMMTGSNALGVAYASNPDLEGKIGSFKIPGEPGTMINAEGYSLSSYATDEQKAAAIDYLKFFNTHDPELGFWQSSGKIPATIEGEKADYISGEDYAGYIDTIESGAMPIVTFPGLSAVKTALGDAYASVFAGEASNEEAVVKLESDIAQILEDNS